MRGELELEAYCMKCKQKRSMKSTEQIKM